MLLLVELIQLKPSSSKNFTRKLWLNVIDEGFISLKSQLTSKVRFCLKILSLKISPVIGILVIPVFSSTSKGPLK